MWWWSFDTHFFFLFFFFSTPSIRYYRKETRWHHENLMMRYKEEIEKSNLKMGRRRKSFLIFTRLLTALSNFHSELMNYRKEKTSCLHKLRQSNFQPDDIVLTIEACQLGKNQGFTNHCQTNVTANFIFDKSKTITWHFFYFFPHIKILLPGAMTNTKRKHTDMKTKKKMSLLCNTIMTSRIFSVNATEE